MDKNNNSAVIIANGEIKDHAVIRKILLSSCGEDALIISADGGVVNTLKLGLIPNVVMGDMDSIDMAKYTGKVQGAEFIPASPDKDESDTQLAVEYAAAMGVKDITITGAAGGRLDHTFANIILLASPSLEGVRVRILTETSEAFIVDSSCTIKGSPGKLISIFSLTPDTYFINTGGLKYALKDEKLDFSPVRGLSNVFTSNEATLDFKNGRLLVIKEI